MDYFQTQAYIGVIVGITVMAIISHYRTYAFIEVLLLFPMINLHNMIVSIFLYKARETKILNFLKIILNFANILRFGSVFGTHMTPHIATLTQCVSLQYLAAIGNVSIRVALTAFLLWQFKQVHDENTDKWIGIILFVIRACLAVPQLGLQRPDLQSISENNLIVCVPNVITLRYYSITEILVEIFIDIYVTVRLILILKKANKNVAGLSTNIGRPKRSLFTVVIYWNFLRLLVIFIFHAFGLADLYTLSKSFIPITLAAKCLINIFLSYVITADAEIVRVIKGKPNQENNKRNQKNPTKSKTKSLLTIDTSDSPSQFLSKLTPHTPRSMKQHEKRLSISEWTNTAIDNFNDEIIEEPRSQNNWDFNNEKIIEEPLSLNNNNHSVTIQLNNTTNND
ncbi:hypothetical protein RhiirC2_820347 [Rhizophagus irregularis]|uniref:Uncharacterized protein n=1 Tax=Rhizophagus irregularis TaxID=588596 RepID=A0A2N1MDL5_9GLOM|nr:hypothetical protein RhiirC2_820347 [Rhizophagus irregularis]